MGLLQSTELMHGIKNSPDILHWIVYKMLFNEKGMDVMSYDENTSVGIEAERDHSYQVNRYDAQSERSLIEAVLVLI